MYILLYNSQNIQKAFILWLVIDTYHCVQKECFLWQVIDTYRCELKETSPFLFPLCSAASSSRPMSSRSFEVRSFRLGLFFLGMIFIDESKQLGVRAGAPSQWKWFNILGLLPWKDFVWFFVDFASSQLSYGEELLHIFSHSVTRPYLFGGEIFVLL